MKEKNNEEQIEALTSQDLISTADNLVNLANNEDKTADLVMSEMNINNKNIPKIKQTVHSFVSDYARKSSDVTDKQFLIKKFEHYPTLWDNQNEIEQTATDIVDTVYTYEQNRRELNEHIAKGKRRESWLSKKIEQGATASGVVNVASYAKSIDTAVDNANNAMMKTIHNLNGSVNQNPNLDGLIAEQHHASTFNIDSAVKEKTFTAEPLESNGKNSVDIVVRDDRGNIVRKYQSKYGKDTETTESYFEKGDYRGQRKLVPKGQGKDIKNANEKIEFTDYKSKNSETVESTPLSKEEAKLKQEKAQREGKIDEYTWNDANKGRIAKRIGGKAALSAGLAVGFQGTRIVGRRIWNWVTGQENQSVEDDVKEFAESAMKSGASAGITIATSGALTVAARSGWLGKILMKTPAGHIAAAACAGIENVKTLYKFATGELTGEEALDQAGRSTCSVVGSLAAGAKGASVGAAIGSVLGPVGSVVGGIAGGIVGGIAGSTLAKAAYSAGKKIVSTVAKGVKAFASGIVHGVGSVVRGIGSFIGGLFGW